MSLELSISPAIPMHPEKPMSRDKPVAPEMMMSPKKSIASELPVLAVMPMAPETHLTSEMPGFPENPTSAEMFMDRRLASNLTTVMVAVNTLAFYLINLSSEASFPGQGVILHQYP